MAADAASLYLISPPGQPPLSTPASVELDLNGMIDPHHRVQAGLPHHPAFNLAHPMDVVSPLPSLSTPLPSHQPLLAPSQPMVMLDGLPQPPRPIAFAAAPGTIAAGLNIVVAPKPIVNPSLNPQDAAALALATANAQAASNRRGPSSKAYGRLKENRTVKVALWKLFVEPKGCRAGMDKCTASVLHYVQEHGLQHFGVGEDASLHRNSYVTAFHAFLSERFSEEEVATVIDWTVRKRSAKKQAIITWPEHQKDWYKVKILCHGLLDEIRRNISVDTRNKARKHIFRLKEIANHSKDVLLEKLGLMPPKGAPAIPNIPNRVPVSMPADRLIETLARSKCFLDQAFDLTEGTCDYTEKALRMLYGCRYGERLPAEINIQDLSERILEYSRSTVRPSGGRKKGEDDEEDGEEDEGMDDGLPRATTTTTTAAAVVGSSVSIPLAPPIVAPAVPLATPAVQSKRVASRKAEEAAQAAAHAAAAAADDTPAGRKRRRAAGAADDEPEPPVKKLKKGASKKAATPPPRKKAAASSKPKQTPAAARRARQQQKQEEEETEAAVAALSEMSQDASKPRRRYDDDQEEDEGEGESGDSGRRRGVRRRRRYSGEGSQEEDDDDDRPGKRSRPQDARFGNGRGRGLDDEPRLRMAVTGSQEIRIDGDVHGMTFIVNGKPYTIQPNQMLIDGKLGPLGNPITSMAGSPNLHSTAAPAQSPPTMPLSVPLLHGQTGFSPMVMPSPPPHLNMLLRASMSPTPHQNMIHQMHPRFGLATGMPPPSGPKSPLGMQPSPLPPSSVLAQSPSASSSHLPPLSLGFGMTPPRPTHLPLSMDGWMSSMDLSHTHRAIGQALQAPTTPWAGASVLAAAAAAAGRAPRTALHVTSATTSMPAPPSPATSLSQPPAALASQANDLLNAGMLSPDVSGQFLRPRLEQLNGGQAAAPMGASPVTSASPASTGAVIADHLQLEQQQATVSSPLHRTTLLGMARGSESPAWVRPQSMPLDDPYAAGHRIKTVDGATGASPAVDTEAVAAMLSDLPESR